jgi:lysozyme
LAKKKGIKPIYIGLFVCVMMAISAAALYYFNKPKFVRYAAFGIDIPNNYQIHGIDVSHYQQTINWQDVKSMEINNIKIGFSFIKATEGKNDVDAAFKRNWKEAKKAGLARGAYHFFNPYVGGKEQAQNFMRTVVLSKGDLPPVLDVEQTGNVQKEVLQQRIKDWLSEVEKNCKYKPIIYTGATFYNQNLAGKR